MEKLNKKRILFSVTILFVAIFSRYMLAGDCDNVDCLYEMKIGLFEPLYKITTWLFFITLPLLLVSNTTFKKWLYYIATPIILFTTLVVSNVSIYAEGFVKLSRSDMAQLGMQFLAFVTLVFLLVQKYLKNK